MIDVFPSAKLFFLFLKPTEWSQHMAVFQGYQDVVQQRDVAQRKALL